MPGSVQGTSDENMAFIETYFPWAVGTPLEAELNRLIESDASPDEIYVAILQSPVYKQMFPGMFDENGQRRYATEAEYLQAVADYRSVLNQYGMYDAANDSPQNYVVWMQHMVSPEELGQRLQIWDEISRGGQELISAFYVYAGMDVSKDDLYRMAVDPSYRQEVATEYDKTVAGGDLDWETYVGRLTDVAIGQLVEAASDQGVNVPQIDRSTAETIMAALAYPTTLGGDGSPTFDSVEGSLNWASGYNGSPVGGGTGAGDTAGDTAGTPAPMTLSELISAFEYAVIGSAATSQGLALPDLQRIEQLRQAGINHVKALQAYGEFSASRGRLSGMLQRTNLGGEFTQNMWEEARMLYSGEGMSLLASAYGQEQAKGRTGQGFGVEVDQSGRLVQRGRTRF